MPLAPWRPSLTRALHHNRSLIYARYLQLATVRNNGQPANRTVVFRGFLNDTNQLKFITDDRSEKIAQIQAQPWGELCWYFPKSREQFRLLGILTIVQAGHPNPTFVQARQQQWQELSDAARLQFAWPHPRKLRLDTSNFAPDAPDALEPLTNFCLLLLDPIQVDHLELRGNPQNRCLYDYHSKTECWTIRSVHP